MEVEEQIEVNGIMAHIDREKIGRIHKINLYLADNQISLGTLREPWLIAEVIFQVTFREDIAVTYIDTTKEIVGIKVNKDRTEPLSDNMVRRACLNMRCMHEIPFKVKEFPLIVRDATYKALERMEAIIGFRVDAVKFESELIEPFLTYVIGGLWSKVEFAKQEHVDSDDLESLCMDLWCGIKNLSQVVSIMKDCAHATVAINNDMKRIAKYIHETCGVDPITEKENPLWINLF